VKRKRNQGANNTRRAVFDVPAELHARWVDVSIATGFDKNAIMAAGLRLVFDRFDERKHRLAWLAFFYEERIAQWSEGLKPAAAAQGGRYTRGRSRSHEVMELPL
jgi:hypothetical protein